MAITKENNPEAYKRILLNNKNNRREAKSKIVNCFGGECSICGYKRCIAALEFHHNGGKESTIASLLSYRKSLKEKILISQL